MMSRLRAVLRDAVGPGARVQTPEEHLRAVMQWLCRAQDAAGGGGVARSYTLRYMRAHGRRGWLAAYPETTGYIIPTFLRYAEMTGENEYRQRALRMAEWESEVQMASGAVQGGVIDFEPTPAIFNTGQVLFGWAAAYRTFGEERFLESAQRAADFLVSAQDGDGAWRCHGSQYARAGVNVYDARSAWGLVETSVVTGSKLYREAGRKNLEFALSRQTESGWFQECCLDDDLRPLLHTIAYTMEGLLEGGLLLDEPRFVDAARRAADALLQRQRKDGSLAGRFDRSWNPSARWSCLTGDAQTAIVWLRLYDITGEPHYRRGAQRLNRYLASTQDLTSNDGGIRGGIKGSQPIWGEYGSYEYLNWAAKFYADAVMWELQGAAFGSAGRTDTTKPAVHNVNQAS